jgi:hypothetical protein
MRRALHNARSQSGRSEELERSLVLGIVVAVDRDMSAYAAYDETIRIPRLATGPTRTLRQRFARERRRRWPFVVIAALAIVALATPVKVPQSAERSAQASELLRVLGR